MLTLYSYWGFENLFHYDGDKNVKLIIDPPPAYFDSELKADRNKYEKLLLVHGCEPPFLNNISGKIIQNYFYFDKIYSFDRVILANCTNSEFYSFGSCWTLTDKDKNRCEFKKDYVNHINIDDKKFKTSFIRSGKRFLPGHHFRYEIDEVLRQPYKFEMYFAEKIPFKFPLFSDSMFHIAIENSRFENYFTEKIVDCFMTYTVPIYWGCLNIPEFFNKDGIILFNNKEELRDILSNLTEEDYFKRMEAMKENYQIAFEKYAFIFDRINSYLNKL